LQENAAVTSNQMIQDFAISEALLKERAV